MNLICNPPLAQHVEQERLAAMVRANPSLLRVERERAERSHVLAVKRTAAATRR